MSRAVDKRRLPPTVNSTCGVCYRSIMRQRSYLVYLPSYITLALLVLNRIFLILPDSLGVFLLPLEVINLFVNATLIYIVQQLPAGPWGITPNPFISTPDFVGWLVASLIVSLAVLILNCLLAIITYRRTFTD